MLGSLARRLPARTACSGALKACLVTHRGSGEEETSTDPARWVFLGPPGVGKGTYASRIAKALGVPHIAAGDLVRAEMKAGSPLGRQMAAIVNQGKLLPDELIVDVLRRQLEGEGAGGWVLDGFPRTVGQARVMQGVHAPSLAINLALRPEVLVAKCLGRRLCSKCGKNWNVADIYLPADPAAGRPEIVMPPLPPPPQCAHLLEARGDDTEEVVGVRLQAYQDEARPVEDFYRAEGVLLDFEITGGIPETLPRLQAALAPHWPCVPAAEEVQREERRAAA